MQIATDKRGILWTNLPTADVAGSFPVRRPFAAASALAQQLALDLCPGIQQVARAADQIRHETHAVEGHAIRGGRAIGRVARHSQGEKQLAAVAVGSGKGGPGLTNVESGLRPQLRLSACARQPSTER